jgi:protein TonB
MLAYAANAPRFDERRSSPNALLAIIAAHVALVAVVMSAKMNLPARLAEPPTVVTWIDPIDPPPPNPTPQTAPRPKPGPSLIHPLTPLPPLPAPDLPPSPALPDPGPVTGSSTGPTFPPQPLPQPTVEKRGPTLLTPQSELKPPYPTAKLLSEEEAVLTLRLTIDERGRVTAVDPVGTADRAFLTAARRHLLAHWRYRPASEGDRAIASSIVITLRFQLEG